MRALALAGDREPVAGGAGRPRGGRTSCGRRRWRRWPRRGRPRASDELRALAQQPGPALRASLAPSATARSARCAASGRRPAAPADAPRGTRRRRRRGARGAGRRRPRAGTLRRRAARRGPGATRRLALVRPRGRLDLVEPKPAEPAKPWVERDGTALAITTSIAAGGLWGGGLSLARAAGGRRGGDLARDARGRSSAGARPGGSPASALRPNAAQALWFANSTAWGALAGLTIWSGSGSDSAKLKYGAAGRGRDPRASSPAPGARGASASRPTETLFADSLVLGARAGAGRRAACCSTPEGPWDVPPAAAIGVVPTLLGAAVASKLIAHLAGRRAAADRRRRWRRAGPGRCWPAASPDPAARATRAATAGRCWAWARGTWRRRPPPASSRSARAAAAARLGRAAGGQRPRGWACTWWRTPRRRALAARQRRWAGWRWRRPGFAGRAPSAPGPLGRSA